MEFKHYIVTRFNLGLYSGEGGFEIKLSPDEWMDHRIELFMKYTLPSVAAQTCQDFKWLILIDPKTPVKYRAVLTMIDNAELVTDSYLSHIPIGDYKLVTTRLDNDDMIHKDFITDIQSSLHDCQYIDVPYGYTLDTKACELYPTWYIGNANITFIEDRGGAVGVYHDNHGRIVQRYTGKQLVGKRYWVITVHGENVANNTKSSPGRNIDRNMPVNMGVLNDYR